MQNKPSKILVTGASGKFGTLVLSHLLNTYKMNPHQIVAASRKPELLNRWSDLGLEVRRADFSDLNSLGAAFRGVEKLLLISTDSMDNDERLSQHKNAVDAARSSGVEHLLYTSLPQPDDSLISFASVHLETESLVKSSGSAWTILRNNWYFENLFFTLPAAIANGTVYSATGAGKIAYAARSDQAQAAAAALLSEASFQNRTFTITGSEALGIEEIASIVSERLQRPLEVIPVSVDSIVQGARAHGLPELGAVALGSFDAATAAGQLGLVTKDLATILGRKPQNFDEWLTQNLEAFAPVPALV